MHDTKEKEVEEEERVVKKMKKKMNVEITSKVTKRGYLKVFEKVRVKLGAMLKNKIGEDKEDQIMEALEDEDISKRVKDMMREEKIQLKNEKN